MGEGCTSTTTYFVDYVECMCGRRARADVCDPESVHITSQDTFWECWADRQLDTWRPVRFRTCCTSAERGEEFDYSPPRKPGNRLSQYLRVAASAIINHHGGSTEPASILSDARRAWCLKIGCWTACLPRSWAPGAT